MSIEWDKKIEVEEIRELTRKYGSEESGFYNTEKGYLKFSTIIDTLYLAFRREYGGCLGCDKSGEILERVLTITRKENIGLRLFYPTILRGEPLRAIEHRRDAVEYTSIRNEDLVIFDNHRAGLKDDLLRIIDETRGKNHDPRSTDFQSLERSQKERYGSLCAKKAVKRLLMIRDNLRPRTITYYPGDFSFELKVPMGKD